MKIKLILLIATLSLLFTGCLERYQTVSPKESHSTLKMQNVILLKINDKVPINHESFLVKPGNLQLYLRGGYGITVSNVTIDFEVKPFEEYLITTIIEDDRISFLIVNKDEVVFRKDSILQTIPIYF